MTDDARPDAGAPRAEQPFDLMETLHILDPNTLEVERKEGGGLIVRSSECGELDGASVEPCFPITAFGRYLLLKNAEDEEIGLIEDVGELSEASMEAVEAELREQHLIPTITRVRDISREFHVPVWEVDTDRGPRRLELKRRRDVHLMRGGRVYIRDAAGNGYLIPDLKELDPASRQLVHTNT
ncbi:MAG: DUF1854 domain-containing protein [Candidatus Brocadiaceae bacterium]|jgi:hypothetical protein